MEKKEVIILGGGGFAKEVAGVLFRLPNHEVLGFLDDNEARISLLGKPRLGALFPVKNDLPTKVVVLGIGHVGKTKVRDTIIAAYEEAGYTFETVIAPSAIIAPGANIGKGVYVGDGAVVQPDTTISDHAIINGNAFIGHDSRIGRNTHICPGGMIAGGVTIGDRCLVGIGGSVIQGITVADNCIVPAGKAVVKNLKEGEHIFLFKI
jgi:UDP-perosamine 4-acetyltransferase